MACRFWIERALEMERIESHVVDAASIATFRRARGTKTDTVDGEALVRALPAYKRGEPEWSRLVSFHRRKRDQGAAAPSDDRT